MPSATARSAHLVGSTPFRDAPEALDIFAERLGPLLRTVPDGETGERKNWILELIESFRQHPDLELAKSGDWSDYDKIPTFRVRRGHRLTADSLDLGYLRHFEASWPEYQKRWSAFDGTDVDGATRFQVGIPGDLNLSAFALGGPLPGLRHRGAFRDATLRDIRAIHRLAGDAVVFQVEVPFEQVGMTMTPGLFHRPAAAFLAGGIVRLAREAPEGTRWGIHLCLGDMNHRALGRLHDTAPIVHLASAIVGRWPVGRHLDFIHAPLAAAAEPPPLEREFYEPLRGLRLPPGTRFVAGFVHEKRTEDEHRTLMAQIDELLGHPVDVACSCGLGRRSRGEALEAIEMAARLCASA
jgi:hypothetical protein